MLVRQNYSSVLLTFNKLVSELEFVRSPVRLLRTDLFFKFPLVNIEITHSIETVVDVKFSASL